MKRAMSKTLTHSRMIIMASFPDGSGKAMWQLKQILKKKPYQEFPIRLKTYVGSF